MTWFITFSLTITRIPNKPFIPSTFVNQFFAFTSKFIFISELLIINTASIYSTFTCTSLMLRYMFCSISSWYSIKYFTIHVFNNIRNTWFSIWIINIITTTTTFIYKNTVRLNWELIIVNVSYFCLYFTFLIIHWNTF